MRILLHYSFAVLLMLLVCKNANSQCNNWTVSTQLIVASTCAGNGSFSVNLYGSDVANLTNIQYGIPIAGNGFSVPLNNSNVFTNIPPGTYDVSVVAMCNGKYVGKNGRITIPGNYTPPLLTLRVARHDLNCGAYGIVYASVNNNRPPYTLTITSAPATYSGPMSFTVSSTTFNVPNLQGGNYTMQVVDACGTGSFPVAINVPELPPNNIDLMFADPVAMGCDTMQIYTPNVGQSSPWGAYRQDTLYKISVQINNGAFSPTSFIPLDSSGFQVKLLPGFQFKDCYGKTLTYTIQPPCGSSYTINNTIPYPTASNQIQQKCNVSFTSFVSTQVLICTPLTYTIQDLNSSASYGPFSSTTTSFVTQPLPLGSYSIQFTTADGYTFSTTTSAAPIVGNPYSVSIASGINGLQNYIEGFSFSTSASLGAKKIELFNGPAGYTYNAQWSGMVHSVSRNQTPTTPGTELFPAGNYVWKITDSCGVYFLPITVGAQDLYQFTVTISNQQQTCQGMVVTPTGTATVNGNNVPVKFSFLRNGAQIFFQQSTGAWQQFASGSNVLLTAPGIYTVVPSAGAYTLRMIPYPNPYTQTFSFNYNLSPVQIDVIKTNGFSCTNNSPAMIYTQGKNGLPFSGTPYKYYLSAHGNGVSGPYIAQNTTGVFTNFGGTANAIYEVKVEDSCGSFSIQQVKILDLQTSRLISNSKYVTCDEDSIQLFAAYFPNATYQWTGPNGFNSTSQTPIIYNVNAQKIGVYRVSIVVPGCSTTVTDSTIITTNPLPPTPLLSYHCGPPIDLRITNAIVPFEYMWQVKSPYSSGNYFDYDYGDSTRVAPIGHYRAYAVDTATGCVSKYSDTLFFGGGVHTSFIASISSPHLDLCMGDTTTLIANANAVAYQWFKNGVPISGATSRILVTNTAGNYKVYVDAGACAKDTSNEVTVNVIMPPTASISAPIQTVCLGDSALITANAGSNYQYTWLLNNVTIPGAQAATYNAHQSGIYQVVVSNGACIAQSNTINITVLALPDVNISPSTNQDICSGSTITFSVPFNGSNSYSWFRNDVLIPNANTNIYSTNLQGIYKVAVTNGICADTSAAISVNLLPIGIYLGNDTIVCKENPIDMMLDAGSGFQTILWSTGATSQQIPITTSGNYWVTATNVCGTYSDTISIQTLTDFHPNLPDDTLICNATNTATFRLPTPLQNVVWSNGVTSHSIVIDTPGIYWVEAQSPCGKVYDTMNVRICTPEITTITVSSSIICEGSCIQLSASVKNNVSDYHWIFSGGNPSSYLGENPPEICYENKGSYPIVLIASNAGGSDTFNTMVDVLPKPMGRFADTVLTVPYKTQLTLPACATGLRIDWYQDGNKVCNNCQVLNIEARYWHSVYTCIVSNEECADTCTYIVEVTNIPSDISIPTAFSPNNDGKNDVFRILTDNPNIYVVDFSIYNRWGQLVFQTQEKNGWNGTLKGAPAEQGVYFWTLRYRLHGDRTRTQHEKKGDVTLVR